MPRKSNTGNRNPEADQSTWRTQLRTRRIKFDDGAKQIYLGEYAKHGRKMDAANTAGVSITCVINHLDNDPEFLEAYEEATASYRDRFVGHAMGLAMNGVSEKSYDAKTGNLTRELIRYPIPLIQMELKRIDSSYKENAPVLSESIGGVLVAPAKTTPEEWILSQEKMNEEKEEGYEPST